uniref:Uncharacterized protein n=1 Tax=Aegilops tauschii subsp. strangulata TaxID=200361 RepID=A0A453RYA1_AEGTS
HKHHRTASTEQGHECISCDQTARPHSTPSHEKHYLLRKNNRKHTKPLKSKIKIKTGLNSYPFEICMSLRPLNLTVKGVIYFS